MCHHGIDDVTSRVKQLGPSDVYMCTPRNHSSNRGTCTPLAPPLKLPVLIVSRAEMVMVPLHV